MKGKKLRDTLLPWIERAFAKKPIEAFFNEKIDSDLLHAYITRVFNHWYAEAISTITTTKPLKNKANNFRRELWEFKGSYNELEAFINKNLEELYKIALTENIGNIVMQLYEQTKEFFNELLIIRKPSILKIPLNIVVRDNSKTPVENALVEVYDEAGEKLFRGITDSNGFTQTELVEGKYRIIVSKKWSKHYGFEVLEIALNREIEQPLVVILKKYERLPPPGPLKVVPETLPYRIQLPDPPPSLVSWIEVHEKFMQICFSAQLKKLGWWNGKKIVNVKHSCTLAAFRRFWDKWQYDPALSPLLVAREMDVLLLSDDEIHGFELKSKKGLSKGDVGYKAEEVYFQYGINYVWVVHARIGDLSKHKEIMYQLEKVCPSAGYIIYSPRELEVLRYPKLNPQLVRNDVKRRNEILKQYFDLVGGKPPYY